MKKFFILCMLLTSMMSVGIHAQGYSILITGNFEAKCLLPNEGPFYVDELPETLVVCEGMKVEYVAYANTNGDNVESWSWYVEGGNLDYSNNENAIVTWGSAGQGFLVVTITTDAGYTYSQSRLVSIVETPVAGAITVPSYNSNHVIKICKGMNVEFTDDSHTTNSDIVGYLWEGCGTTSTSRNFTLENVTSGCTITHRVYNNCGCYDEEEFYIDTLKGDPLVISCYGTACEGSFVKYQATSPSCSNYTWIIDGGTLVSEQGRDTFIVEWGHPQDGYGVISLDGNLCGGNSCHGHLSVKVPIIIDGVDIAGQTSVCEGEAVVYSVPLYGSTKYTWTISNSNDVDEIRYNDANKIIYKFDRAGTYFINVEYGCEFLTCGTFNAHQLEVKVKPKLEIEGEDVVCLTNNARYTTNSGAYCTWTVYDLYNNGQVYISSQPETEFFTTGNITAAGVYKITASEPNYCNVAEFVISVKDPPPAPTILNMDPGNPTVACPRSGIHLLGKTYNPEYNLIWQTACEPNSSASGDDVTLFYDDEVCDVEVYTYDRRLRCRSDNAYSHHVEPFELEPVSLPSDVQVVCPGTLITWTGNDVPYQPEVIYKWELADQKQYCATIEGDKHSNTISLRINDFPQPFNTQTFDLYLYRTYCSGIADTDTVHLQITDNPNATIGITPPNGICQWMQASLQGTGCSGDYQWNIAGDNHTYTGNPFNHTFKRSGYYDITMSCNPYDYCTNREYYTSVTTSVYVTPQPVVDIFYDGTNVYTVPPMSTNDYLFEWGHTTTNSSIVPGNPNQSSYTCTITSLTAPYCSVTVGTSAGSGSTPCGPLTVQQVGTFDYCNRNIQFQVPNPPSNILWNIQGDWHGTLSYTGTYNQTVTIPIDSVGNYLVTAATSDQPCYRGHAQFTVDFLPRFDIEKHCTYVTIINKSMYTDTNKFMTLSVNNTTMGTYRVNKDTINYYTGNGGTFDFKLTGYDMQTFSIPCNIGSVTITNSAGSSVTITTANPYNQSTTCTNTPIELTAAIAPPHTVVSTHWEFGDHDTFLDTVGGSVYHTFKHTGGLSPYHVKVTVIDENGCASKDSIDIVSKTNPLEVAGTDFLYSYPVCPGLDVYIRYLASLATPPATSYYNWIEFSETNQSNVRIVNGEGTYHVDAFNHDYCTGKASQSVSYFGKPSAIIIPKKYSYCTGETIVLYGEPDDNHSYQYSWTVYNTTTGMTSNYNTGTVTFPAGNNACNYIIDLTVTDAHGCTNSATTLTLPVQGPPQAPDIGFGHPHCIHVSPIKLVSDINETHWSNGRYGPGTYYDYPGVAMAWYYDYNTGCRSDSAILKMPEPPDFDALLTGCYNICENLAFTELPVYGMLPWWQEYGWEWFYNNNPFAGQSFGSNAHPLLLPLNGFGKYRLDVNYHDDCIAKSKQLVLTKADHCKCDGLDVSCQINSVTESNCQMFYDIDVTVCNNSNPGCCLKELIPQYDTRSGNITMTNTTFAPNALGVGNCITFNIILRVTQFTPTIATFKLIDGCNNCETYFSVELTPSINCTTDIVTAGNIATFNTSLSGGELQYYDFATSLSWVSNVLAVWSSPASIVNYNFNTTSHALTGLCVFESPSTVGNFYLYALVCTGQGLCVYRYIIDLGIVIIEPGMQQSKRGSGVPPETTDAPQLKPNPATGMVGVVSNDEVTEVLVMDMKGRQMATFSNTTSFNVANLATGTYIVRIKSIHGADAIERITYLKLVKQ